MGEVYIPIPAEIHNQFPNFFPSRDVHFDLTIPTGETFKAKVCQDNSNGFNDRPKQGIIRLASETGFQSKRGRISNH